MRLSKNKLRKIIRESVSKILTESLAIKAHIEKLFGGKANLDKWGDLYGQGGQFQEQAIILAQSLLGDDNWEIALIHARSGRHMTPEQKLAQQAGGHTQGQDEFFKAMERRKIRKELGDEKYEKIKALTPEQRPYYTGKLPGLDPDYPKDVSHSQRGMDRFGGSGQAGQRIDHDMHGHGYSSPQKTPFGAQQSAFLGSFGYREDAFEQPFYSKLGMASNPDDVTTNHIIKEIGADFIFAEIEVYNVYRIDDFDYGSFLIEGETRFGDESEAVRLRIQPGLIYDESGEIADYDLNAPFTVIYEDDYTRFGRERDFDPSKQTEEEMRGLLSSDLTDLYYNQ